MTTVINCNGRGTFLHLSMDVFPLPMGVVPLENCPPRFCSDPRMFVSEGPDAARCWHRRKSRGHVIWCVLRGFHTRSTYSYCAEAEVIVRRLRDMMRIVSLPPAHAHYIGDAIGVPWRHSSVVCHRGAMLSAFPWPLTLGTVFLGNFDISIWDLCTLLLWLKAGFQP